MKKSNEKTYFPKDFWQVWIYKKQGVFDNGHVFSSPQGAFAVIKQNDDKTMDTIYKTVHVVKKNGKYVVPEG